MVKVSIKTLKNEQFQVDVELTDTIGVVKEKVEAIKSDLPASRQKLIHSGKVLKDETPLSETGITENDFIVCMVTKEAAKPKTSTPVAAAAASSPAAAPASPAPATATAAPLLSTPAPAPQATAPPAAPRAPTQTLDAETVRQLTDMGFPQDQAEAALRAAMGNSGLAVEYLMSGIPDNPRGGGALSTPTAGGSASPATPAAAGSGSGIEQLRRHPQLNDLRRLVQQNPGALSQVLEAIGQQNPELLRLIHANQAEFLAMMNEPITEEQTPAQSLDFGGGGAGAGGEGDMPNPLQLIQMIQMLPPDQRAAAAQSLGMTPEQLQAFSQMLATLPPDQLNRLMREGGGRGGGGGGPPPGANVIRLTEEEMGAVNRLVELGFNQQDAVAAYLACDKNEGLAANLLLEGWSADDAGGGAGGGF